MRKGFTLIELLVVVLIIGVLAAVALPQYQKAVAKSRIVEFLLQGEMIRRDVILYEMANGGRPDPSTETLDCWDRVSGKKAYIGNREWGLTSSYINTSVKMPGIDLMDCYMYIKHVSYYNAVWCYTNNADGKNFVRGLGWKELGGEGDRIRWQPPFSWTKK